MVRGFVLNPDDLCAKTDGFCAKIDEFCVSKMMYFAKVVAI